MDNKKSKPETEEKQDSLDAKEVLAFFAGVAIVFTLVNKLFFVPFMSIEEVVYGLTFADESVTVQKIVYACAIFALSFSIIIPIVVQILKLRKMLNILKKVFLFFEGHRICTIAILLFVYSPLIVVMCGFFEEYKVYMSLVYVVISCLVLILFIKCTILGRILLIFTCLMVGYWCYFAVNGYKNNDYSPVTITLQDGTTIKALRCTISREGLAVIKDSEKKQRIIPVSKIMEIAEDKNASSNKSEVEDPSESQKQGKK